MSNHKWTPINRVPSTMRHAERNPASMEEKLLRRSTRQKDGCLVWMGFRTKDGYGRLNVRVIEPDGRRRGMGVSAHRKAYEVWVGPIPEGLTIDHLCRNRACIEPTHLEAVTDRVNILRGNTIARRNSEKTHCVRGHPLSGENLILRRRSPGSLTLYRQCHICTLIRQRDTVIRALARLGVS